MIGTIFDHPIKNESLIVTAVTGDIAICKYINNGKITAISIKIIKDILSSTS